MSYTVYIYPIEVMQALEAGGDVDEMEEVPFDPAARTRLLTSLEQRGYQLTREQDGIREYEKDFDGQPVEVGVYDSEIAFSTPYWDKLDAVLSEILMEVIELVDSPSLVFYDPQRDEWVSGE